jgi:hypothetical protein
MPSALISAKIEEQNLYPQQLSAVLTIAEDDRETVSNRSEWDRDKEWPFAPERAAGPSRVPPP